MTYDHSQALVDRLRGLARDMEAYVAGRHNPRDNQIARWAETVRRIADDADPSPPWESVGDGTDQPGFVLTDRANRYLEGGPGLEA